MQSFRVISVVYDEENGRIEVVKEITEDDGSTSLNLHTFNPETLEWKAAEYDIADVDELFDIVMHEPFIDDVRPLQLDKQAAKSLVRARVAALKAGATSTKLDGRAAATPAEKTTLRNRLNQAGVPDKYVAAVDENPLVVIRRHCPFDEEVIDVKRNHLEKSRQEVAAERANVRQQMSPTERAEALSRSLERSSKRTPPHEPDRQPNQPQPNASTLESIEMVRGRPVKSDKPVEK